MKLLTKKHKIPDEFKRMLDEIKGEKVESKDEITRVPIIENIFNVKKAKATVYRVQIPKKYADQIELNKKDFEALFTLQKNGEMKLIMEIVKK